MSSKFLFAKGAVLYSRIRPYFQKVTVAPFDGICSTEIYPLVPNEKIIPEYLMDLLLSSSFTRYAIAGMKGTGFPRVSHDYIG
jgi:type I restriction enzyme, S subunit